MIPYPDFVVLRFSFSWWLVFAPCICCGNCSTSICSSGSSAVACEATSFARNSLQSPSNAGATSSFKNRGFNDERFKKCKKYERSVTISLRKQSRARKERYDDVRKKKISTTKKEEKIGDDDEVPRGRRRTTRRRNIQANRWERTWSLLTTKDGGKMRTSNSGSLLFSSFFSSSSRFARNLVVVRWALWWRSTKRCMFLFLTEEEVVVVEGVEEEEE